MSLYLKQRHKLAKRYFTEHPCALKPTPDAAATDTDVIKKKSLFRQALFFLKKAQGLFHNVIVLNINDARSGRLFESFSECATEIERQLAHFPFTIHPYSKLRRIIEGFFCLYILSFATLYSIVACIPDELTLFKWCSVLEFIYFISMFCNFLTGYVHGNTRRTVVLKLKNIARHYLTTWFILDLISVVWHIPLMIWPSLIFEPRCRALFVISKVARIFVLLKYAANVIESFDIKMSVKTTIESFILMYSFIIWNITFQYEIEYYMDGNVTSILPRECSWITITKLHHESSHMKWLYGLERAVSMMRFKLSLQIIEYSACVEVFMMVAWILGKVIVVHCLFKYAITVFGRESAKAKYYVMKQQVKKFINQKSLPKTIKHNLLKYYDLRFRSHFFVESRMLGCVSGQLAEDILVYSGRLAVKDVGFLQQLPRSLLLKVGTQLTVVYYIAGDIIFRVNSIGDCIYFIHKGTVAIYTESGIEAYHMEDGEYFGAASFSLKFKFRWSTAVAVTDCELFQLSEETFETVLSSCPGIQQELLKEATNKLQRHFVLEEKFRSQLKEKSADNEW